MDGCCGPGYASPAEAIKAPKEKLLYTNSYLHRDRNTKTRLFSNCRC